jgi:hypothetical protein
MAAPRWFFNAAFAFSRDLLFLHSVKQNRELLRKRRFAARFLNLGGWLLFKNTNFAVCPDPQKPVPKISRES